MRAQRYFYDHGLPFGQTLFTNLEDLVIRIRKKKASMVILDGGVGEGKTTLAVHIADAVNKIYDLPPISLELKNHPQLGLGGSEFTKNLRVCWEKKLPACIYDEAGDFNSRGALTRFNAMINRIFETFRGFKILVIVCLPSFGTLDRDLLKKEIPRLLLHCHDRGERSGEYDGHSLYNMHYLKDKMKGLVIESQAYKIIQPNFRGHFLDLEPERSKALDTLSTKGKIEALKQSEIKLDGLVSYNDLARKVGRSVIWCRVAINELKIKPTRIIRRASYFHESVINRLVDHLQTKNEQRKSLK